MALREFKVDLLGSDVLQLERHVLRPWPVVLF